MVTFKEARDELYRRMAKVAEGFADLYPGVQAPKVYDGSRPASRRSTSRSIPSLTPRPWAGAPFPVPVSSTSPFT